MWRTQAEWLPEAAYPFSLADVAAALPWATATTPGSTRDGPGVGPAGDAEADNNNDDDNDNDNDDDADNDDGNSNGGAVLAPNERRAGWYLQQLLKLYAHAVCATTLHNNNTLHAFSLCSFSLFVFFSLFALFFIISAGT